MSAPGIAGLSPGTPDAYLRHCAPSADPAPVALECFCTRIKATTERVSFAAQLIERFVTAGAQCVPGEMTHDEYNFVLHRAELPASTPGAVCAIATMLHQLRGYTDITLATQSHTVTEETTRPIW